MAAFFDVSAHMELASLRSTLYCEPMDGYRNFTNATSGRGVREAEFQSGDEKQMGCRPRRFGPNEPGSADLRWRRAILFG